MNTIQINRGELTAIPFSITDAANGLAGKRVTWSLAQRLSGPRVLRKESATPGSTAAVTISGQAAGLITGFVNILLADYDTLVDDQYYATLWVDDGAGNDRCVTPGGADMLQIVKDVARPA